MYSDVLYAMYTLARTRTPAMAVPVASAHGPGAVWCVYKRMYIYICIPALFAAWRAGTWKLMFVMLHMNGPLGLAVCEFVWPGSLPQQWR